MNPLDQTTDDVAFQRKVLAMEHALQCIANAAKLAPQTDMTISAILLAGCSEMARRVIDL